MKLKKVTTTISHIYEERSTDSNERIAERIKSDLVEGSNPRSTRIESVTVEDVQL